MNNLIIEKSIALLVDPDNSKNSNLPNLLKIASENKVDYIMVGGSLTSSGTDEIIRTIKKKCSIPVILFPGNLLQLSTNADLIFLLSLISGRNPELLIGNHVIAAPFLKGIKEKVISVGYILINCGTKTSVEYISQTEAIPSDKTDIAVATAMAGEMLGLKMIYLEAGSGAANTVPVQMIAQVKENISIPLIVGGGIRDKNKLHDIFNAGADLIVLGNSCEENPAFLKEACLIRDTFKNIKSPI
jgi:phosphoglycerol geranylgeranyltransferase